VTLGRSHGGAGRRMIAPVTGAGMSGLAAAGAARLAYSVLNRYPPGGPKAWSRMNHRGEHVTLLEGPAVAVGAIAGVLAQAGVQSLAGSAEGRAAWRGAAAIAVAGAGGAAFGAYDDLAGSSDRRGFRGHLGALRQGEVTTGAVKLAGIGATGMASAALSGGNAADFVINTGLVAGFANLLNLFDLRPGRAIKAAVASGALVVLGGSVSRGAQGQGGLGGPGSRGAVPPGLAPPLAAALALLPEDLGERAMLGDAGANALGAMIGAAACSLPRPARVALLAGTAWLNVASEKVSFTAVIERTPALRRLDLLGRRPASPPPPIVIPVQRGADQAADHDIAPPRE
jgi:UDP-GlcNAc:undecaprenyl-phosphate/decaprenyl-phosphate GlcNAc-1-phosphate transferase